MGKLTATAVKAAVKEPGRYGDGEGLFLEVRRPGTGSWIVRVQKDGRRRDIGLGSLSKVSLALARERAAAVRTQVEMGLDPLMERERSSGLPTFRKAATLLMAEQKRTWKNAKHGAQWLAMLEAYAFPTMGELRVDRIETGHVRDALGPIWIDKPETARRVRQRIGAVLDFAVGKNWRSHGVDMRIVSKALPRQPKERGRFEAMPYADVPDFIATLRERVSMGRLALEALILTAARSGEIRGARWNELDLEAGTWTVPAARMKAGKEHVVALSKAAISVFERAKALRIASSDLVFPGATRGKPMSDMTLTKVLRDAGLKVTAHGFRSSFRDWAAEQTNIAGEVAEAALAHTIPNRVEAAYRRTNFLEKRRDLMERWGRFCVGSEGNVVPLSFARASRE
jgi:integrase